MPWSKEELLSQNRDVCVWWWGVGGWVKEQMSQQLKTLRGSSFFWLRSKFDSCGQNLGQIKLIPIQSLGIRYVVSPILSTFPTWNPSKHLNMDHSSFITYLHLLSLVNLSFHSFNHLFIYSLIHLLTHSSNHPSAHPPIRPSICSFIQISSHISILTHFSIYLPILLPTHCPTHPSIPIHTHSSKIRILISYLFEHWYLSLYSWPLKS